MEKITYITKAKEILDIIKPIPAKKFLVDRYGDLKGNSCFLGHIHRVLNPEGDENNYIGDQNGYGARTLTEKFLVEKHNIRWADGAFVNNGPVNGYKQPTPKKRIVALLKDMIKEGY